MLSLVTHLRPSRIYKSDPPPKSPSSGVGLWSLRSITKNYPSLAGSYSGSLFYFVERPSLCSRWSHTCGTAAFTSLTLPLNPPPREWDFGRCAPVSSRTTASLQWDIALCLYFVFSTNKLHSLIPPQKNLSTLSCGGLLSSLFNFQR